MKPDTTYLQQVRTNPDYQYFDGISQNIQDADSSGTLNAGSSFWPNFYDLMNSQFMKTISVMFVIALLLLIIYLAIKKMMPYANETEPQSMGEDTIYNHDWPQEIEQAMSREDYSQVVVLAYLRWLDTLDADHLIKFDVSKTPGMFIDEVSKNAPAETHDHLMQKTRTLTNHYLRIRYGHRKADAQLAKQLIEL